MNCIKLLFSLLLFGGTINSFAQDTVKVKETQIPVLIERQDNVLYYIRLNAKESRSLDYVTLTLNKNVPLKRLSR